MSESHPTPQIGSPWKLEFLKAPQVIVNVELSLITTAL